MKLHSKILGEGKDLLILHGLFGQSDNWQTLGKQFSEHFRVHLIDQRNHGHSFHSDDWNYELMAEDVLRYMDDEGIEKALVLGHSMGGKTAMMLSTLNPQRVEKLVVVDIAPKAYAPHHQQILAGLKAINFDQHQSRKDAEEAMTEHIGIPSVRQFLLKNLYWETKERLAWRFNLKVIAEHIEEVGKALPAPAYADIPALFVHGANSDYLVEGDEDLIEKHFPQAEIVEVPNAGHWIHAENPKDFMKETLQFLC